MKIAVIGAGAMGSLFGAYLGAGGNEVSLVDIWDDHVKKINTGGLMIYEEGGPRNFELTAVTDPARLGRQELVIVFVKSYHTAAALKRAKNLLGEGTQVLTLQNGLGNVEAITGAAGEVTVIAGTTSHGATLLGPARIKHAGVGETVIGKISGKTDRSAEIAAEFSRCGLETRVSDNIAGLIWGKLLVNVGINALTALLGVTNGRLTESESTLQLMKTLVSEGEAVARARGITLPYADTFGKVVAVARATAENRSSMLQDIDRRYPTEIDFINGAVAREGARTGIPTPANRLVTLLIKSLEEKGQMARN